MFCLHILFKILYKIVCFCLFFIIRYMQKISVILPCYNEYENIAPLYKEIISVIASDFKGRAYEIIMVDDGSKD
ncbi:TPA: hypothetical protein DEP21_04325 [Patescibacteria group bacterium]|nr:hypothetical protein [Candidatus Gracilibacteria bacterium]